MNDELDLMTPPHDEEAERCVIACMLRNEESIEIAIDSLTAENFYVTANQLIFSAITDLYDSGKKVDIVVVRNELANRNLLERCNGALYLGEVFMAVGYTANIREYVNIVREKAVQRELVSACNEIRSKQDCSVDDLVDFAENAILNVSKIRSTHNTFVSESLQDMMKSNADKIVGGKTRGIMSGCMDLDEYTGGLQGGQLIIVAGRPGSGKTSFALHLLKHATIVQKAPAILFSFEMGGAEIARNMICSIAMVNSKKLESGNLSELEYRKLLLASTDFCDAPLIIEDSGKVSIAEIKARVRRLKKEIGLRLVVIDYIQLMGFDASVSDDRQLEVARISRALKNLSREADIPVVACCQLNREIERRDNHRPLLSDLRESGSLEQDADVVIFTHNDESFNEASVFRGICEAIIAKQRNGPTGNVRLAFQKEFTRFDDFVPVVIGGEMQK